MVHAADYLRDIKPVLKARCYACHGALKQKAGLRVDSAANIRKGAKSDSIVIAGDPEQSELLVRVTSGDEHERMPPEGAPLKAHEIAAIREWITAGLPLPENEKAEIDPKEHWAFQNPKKVTLLPLPLQKKKSEPISRNSLKIKVTISTGKFALKSPVT